MVALLVIGSLIGVIGLVIIDIGFQNRQEAILALNGELDPFPLNLSENFTVQLSQNFNGSPLTNINFTSQQLASGIDMNQVFPASSGTKFGPFMNDELKIDFINNKLYVSATIVNSNGTTIAEILNNEWKTVDPSTLLFWDRNYNAYAFEIIGSDGVPTFQVIMTGPNRIEIGGLFYTTHGTIYFQPMSDGTMLYINETEMQLEAAHIPTIFKYPALTDPNNLGKMTDAFYPSSNPLSQSTWTIAFGIFLATLGSILGGIGLKERKSIIKRQDFQKYLSQVSVNRNTSSNAWRNSPRYKRKKKASQKEDEKES